MSETDAALATLAATARRKPAAPELRKACQAAGIKWRNAHGKGKHLSVKEMTAALTVTVTA